MSFFCGCVSEGGNGETESTFRPIVKQPTTTTKEMVSGTTVDLSVEDMDPRCFLRPPQAYGNCQTRLGSYYDFSQATCISLVGCDVRGEIPFTGENPQQECLKLCKK